MDDQRVDRTGGGSLIKQDLGLAAFVVFAIWLPYLLLELDWILLVRSDPNQVHGEASGPILYFLPILLWIGICGSGCVVATWVAYILWRKRSENKSNPTI
jgi:hypothetical protein